MNALRITNHKYSRVKASASSDAMRCDALQILFAYGLDCGWVPTYGVHITVIRAGLLIGRQ